MEGGKTNSPHPFSTKIIPRAAFGSRQDLTGAFSSLKQEEKGQFGQKGLQRLVGWSLGWEGGWVSFLHLLHKN